MSTLDVRSRGASMAAIQSHYDVGNGFYALWLDPTLTYSCALWHGDEDLNGAQLAKIDWHLSNVGAGPASHILDIGCGWGGLMRRAVETHGVAHITGLTLSAAQADWIESLCLPRAVARLQDWKQQLPAHRYDGIVSIGAFEHFARLELTPEQKLEAYREFFRACHTSLRPGGRLSLQSITYESAERRDFSRFFAEEIFPESDLPHLHEILLATRGLFEVELLRNDRKHYERTAQSWLSSLRSRREAAERLVGPAMVQRYQKYLGLLAVAFHTGTMNLARISMRRIG